MIRVTLDKFDNPTMGNMKQIIHAMITDIEIEGKDEIEMSQQAKKYIGKNTAKLFKYHLQKQLEEQ